MILFLLLKLIFDTFLWKIPLIYRLPLMSEKPPDISGYYEGYVLWLHPFRQDNNRKRGKSNVRVLIDQNWDSITVYFRVIGGIYQLLDENQQILGTIVNPDASGNRSVSDMAVIKSVRGSKDIALHHSYERRRRGARMQYTPQGFFNNDLQTGTSVLIFEESFFTNRKTEIQGHYYTDYGAYGNINLAYKKSLWKYQLQSSLIPLKKKWKRLLRNLKRYLRK